MGRLQWDKSKREALTHIHRYERGYGVTFSEFERRKLPRLNTLRAHEDYNGGFFWTGVLERVKKALGAFRKMETVE